MRIVTLYIPAGAPSYPRRVTIKSRGAAGVFGSRRAGPAGVRWPKFIASVWVFMSSRLEKRCGNIRQRRDISCMTVGIYSTTLVSIALMLQPFQFINLY